MRVQVHRVFEVSIGDTVFGLFEDLFLRVIGAEVALATVFRLTSTTR